MSVPRGLRAHLAVAGVAAGAALMAAGCGGGSNTSTGATGSSGITKALVALVPTAKAFGESVAASSSAGQMVAATTWGADMAVVKTWWRPPNGAWSPPAMLLPPGFHRSYDASAATLSDGSLAVVAGADLARRKYCLDGASVALMRRDASGAVHVSIVDDQHGTGRIDDRPMIAAGSGGQAWVGWAQGTLAHSCDVIGGDDRIRIARSSDHGATFGSPIAVPSAGIGPDFGVQIAPVGSGDAWVSWSALSPRGAARVMLVKVQHGQVIGAPQTVASVASVPQLLPGATFPSFSTPTITIADHQPVLAWPHWVAGQAVITIGARIGPQGQWRYATVLPGRGQDLILPALATQGDGSLRLVYAIHVRSTDAVGYASCVIRMVPSTGRLLVGPTEVVAAPVPGPGFHELGESLQLTADGMTTTTALTVGSSRTSQIISVVWHVVPSRQALSGTATTGSP